MAGAVFRDEQSKRAGLGGPSHLCKLGDARTVSKKLRLSRAVPSPGLPACGSFGDSTAFCRADLRRFESLSRARVSFLAAKPIDDGVGISVDEPRL